MLDGNRVSTPDIAGSTLRFARTATPIPVYGPRDNKLQNHRQLMSTDTPPIQKGNEFIKTQRIHRLENTEWTSLGPHCEWIELDDEMEELHWELLVTKFSGLIGRV